jgi:hypothetical protein
MRTSVLVLGAALLPLAAGADEIFLKSGGQLSGRIVNRTATTIEVDIGAGRITVQTSQVVRVEEGRSALQAYEERAARLAAADANGWVELAEWASAQGLGTQAREAYHRALAVAPGDPRANAGVGNVEVGGRWVSEDEGYQAKGYVRFEGEWITPVEHAAILRERAAEADQERARQADARAQEAALEAEARARAAEAQAAAESQDSNQGLPLWYAWGAGPAAWNTGSIAMRPARMPATTPIGVRR